MDIVCCCYLWHLEFRGFAEKGVTLLLYSSKLTEMEVKRSNRTLCAVSNNKVYIVTFLKWGLNANAEVAAKAVCHTCEEEESRWVYFWRCAYLPQLLLPWVNLLSFLMTPSALWLLLPFFLCCLFPAHIRSKMVSSFHKRAQQGSCFLCQITPSVWSVCHAGLKMLKDLNAISSFLQQFLKKMCLCKMLEA